MLYLTVGTDNIKKELFVPVSDRETGFYKPSGGVWFTKNDPKYNNYNVWVDYLMDNPHVFFHKNKSNNIWVQPCSVVELKDDTNIFNLNNEDEYNYLLDKFPMNNKCFSYELMSHSYDGIYVDIMSLIHNKNDDLVNLIRQYCVSTLLLFNIECIDYYYSGKVDIVPFDLDFNVYECINYNITYDKIKKRVK